MLKYNLDKSRGTDKMIESEKEVMINKKEQFISSLSYEKSDVQQILQTKIAEENIKVIENTTNENTRVDKCLMEKINYRIDRINIISLFSGAGGLDLGVELSSLVSNLGEDEAYNIFKNRDSYELYRQNLNTNFIYSNDLFKEANITYTHHFPSSVVKDSRDIRKVINFPKSDLILGGFPCPGFSSAGPRLLDDPRNFLYIHYIRALTQSKPAFFIAENVKGLLTMANGQVLEQIKEDFSSVGYTVTTHLVNARDYGVPQLRERVFIIGVRDDISNRFKFRYELPDKTHGPDKKDYITLKDTISDLPLKSNDVFESDYSSMYMSRNRKKTWDEQSFTIQASGRQAPQHPYGEPMEKIDKDKWIFKGEFNRRMSVRECARVQSFPDWYDFSIGVNKDTSKNNQLNQQYKQIGNAVPVFLAEKISRPIIKFLSENINDLNDR